MLVFKKHALGCGWNRVEPGRLRIEHCVLSRSWLLMAPPNSLNCEARRSQEKRGLFRLSSSGQSSTVRIAGARLKFLKRPRHMMGS